MDSNNDQMLRRIPSCLHLLENPLIVYKISSEIALDYVRLMVIFLAENPQVKNVYLESEYIDKFQTIKNEISTLNFVKIKAFNIKMHYTDICIILGGDGTALWANHLYGLETRPPFLTFNIGTLGYMTYYDCKQYKEILSNVFDINLCSFIMEKRSQLYFRKINVDKSRETILEGVALNDIVIDRASNHAVTLNIYMNEEFLTKIKCDGIIASTSTGSTAYSLSAGGSIIHYDVDCLLFSAISPHSLSCRPIVFPKDISIRVLIDEKSAKANMSNDGVNNFSLERGEGFEISLSDKYINIIVLEKYVQSPFKLWKNKLVEQLGWNNAFKNLV